jgi:cell division inhibitor SulA/protein ImuA
MAPLLRQRLIEDLRSQLGRWESAVRPAAATRVSSGHAVLDRLLPDGGFHRGGLVEWLASDPGSGAGSLALATAREAAQGTGPLVVIDGQGEFYPPAAALAGIDWSSLILVRPTRAEDERWAWEQALRCPGVGAVLGWSERYDQRTRRRWQLAVESSAGLGLLVCPARVRDEPCWAEARLLVEPLPSARGRRVRVEVLRARGMLAGASVELELADETSALPLAPPVAAPTTVRRSARA